MSAAESTDRYEEVARSDTVGPDTVLLQNTRDEDLYLPVWEDEIDVPLCGPITDDQSFDLLRVLAEHWGLKLVEQEVDQDE